MTASPTPPAPPPSRLLRGRPWGFWALPAALLLAAAVAAGFVVNEVAFPDDPYGWADPGCRDAADVQLPGGSSETSAAHADWEEFLSACQRVVEDASETTG